jgi:hypothetical protein
MTEVTLTLTDEEMLRLEELSGQLGLSVTQLVRLGIRSLVNQPDDTFRAAADRVWKKNADRNA